MKRLLIYLFSILLTGFLILTCSDEQIPTASTYKNESVLMKSSESGAMILRYESEGAFAFFDADTKLILLLGINDISKFCENGWPEGLDLFSIKDIILPNNDPELRRYIEQIKSRDLTALIWHTDDWWVNFCDFAANNVALASGNVNFIATDNDLLSWDQDNKNHNAFGFKANGTLIGSDGQIYKLNFVNHIIWDGEDSDTSKEVLKIQLTPIGKK